MNRHNWRIPFCALLGITVFSYPLKANNGYVVIADAATNIEVDGDFADWPDTVSHHRIRHNVYGSPIRGEQDCNATFRAAYDREQHLLYVAVEVKDESFVINSPKEHWSTRDGNGIRLGMNHGADGVVGVDFVVKGNDTTSRGDRVFAAVQREDGAHRYEWKLDLKLLGEQSDLSKPFTCSFDVDVTDDDEDGTFHSQFWSPLPFKMIDPDRVGDIVLGVDPEQCGAIKGYLTPANVAKQMGKLLIRIESTDNPNLVVDLLTDERGNYEIDLPAGRYRRSLRLRGKNFCSTPIAVKACASVSDPIDVVEVAARTVGQINPDATKTIGSGFPSLTHLELSGLIESELTFTTYNASDGMLESDITSIVEDKLGYLWIGYHGGLMRFDGRVLDTFTNLNGIENVDVHALLSDEDAESIWIGTNDGLFHFDSINNRLTTHGQLAGKMVLSLGRTPLGQLCVGTTDGLFVLDGETFRFFSESSGIPSPVQAIELDVSEQFTWIGTESGLLRFDGTSFLPINQDSDEAGRSRRIAYSWEDGLHEDRIFALHSDASGLWIGAGDSIYCYDKGHFHRIYQSKSERYKFARSFHRDHSGALWVATQNAMLRIPPTAENISQAREQIQISDSPIANAVYTDASGTVWSGHFDGTLRRYDSDLTQVYAGDCRSIAVDSGGAVIFIEGTHEDGRAASWLCRYKLGQIERYRVPGRGIVLCVDGKDILIGTEKNGLFRFDGEVFAPLDVFPDQKPKTVDMHRCPNGDVWFATNAGLYRRESNGRIERLTTAHGLLSDRVNQVDQCRDGRIVVGTLHGVSVIDEQRNFKNLTKQDGLLSNFVTALHVDRDDHIWIGTLNGLHAYRDGKLTDFTTADGLIRNHVDFFVCDDHEGEMWIGSAVGISRFRSDESVVQTLDASDRIGRGEIRDVVDDGRNMWLAGSRGLFRYTKAKNPPRMVLDEVVTDQLLGAPKFVRTTSDQQHLRLDFHAVSLSTRKDAMLYRYRIEGIDNDWMETSNTYVEYAALPAGKYLFEAYAVDQDLNPSKMLSVPIHVSPPYSRYALLSSTAMAIIVCLTVIGLYIRGIRNANQKLEQRVAKRTAEREELQKQLLHSQKMESLGTLAAGVAHDFNNILCVIMANAELTTVHGDRNDTHRNEHLNRILEACNQAAGMTKSLLTFGGKTELDVKPNELGRMIHSCMVMMRRTMPASIEINFDLPNVEHWASVDSSQFQQVLINLCVNARDAMPQGGNIEIELVSRKSGITRSNSAYDIHVIRVKDTGAGIPVEFRDRIFEPFFTTKPRGKGTGLGLAMAQQIVTQHGGQMILESRPAGGCVFEIELLACSKPKLPDDDAAKRQAAFNSIDEKRLVIVADDDKMLLAALTEALEATGLEVIPANDGHDFLQKAKRYVDQINLVVLDIDMPKMNGIDCLSELRKIRAEIDAVVISGLATHESEVERDNRTVFLRKPFSIHKFIELVEAGSKHSHDRTKRLPNEYNETNKRSGHSAGLR